MSQCWVTLGVSVLGLGQAKLVLPILSRSVVAVARFLKAIPVSAVWCEFFDPDHNTWSKPRLLLATETALSAETIVRLYVRRPVVGPRRRGQLPH